MSRNFGDVWAVKDAWFDLPKGRFLTILGPSGSGKTTLLRMIAGFDAPTSGEIHINGKPVNAVPPHKRAIGMVFQRLALFPHMTAAENIAFPLKMRRHDARTIPEKVERCLELVRLGGYGERRIDQLSGGQQQRIAIARALVFEPDLLLLDEPLAALDRKLREEMQLEFRRIQRELGVTTINVTHDQREALIVSDEIIVMDGGEIQQKAKPAEIYRKPKNAFVANFIGVTNFIPGKVRLGPDGVSMTTLNGFDIRGVAGDEGDQLVDGGSGVSAIRAEQIRLASHPSNLADLDAALEGIVIDAIFEGARVVYAIHPVGLDAVTLKVFDHDPAEHTQFKVGRSVFLGWNSSDVLVFNV